MSAGRSLFRRSAIALAAAGLALATVVAAVHPAELVLSQGQDTEAAQANVAANWPVAYAGNQAYSVQFSKRGEGSTNYAVDSNYRWQLQNFGSSQGTTAPLQTNQRIRQPGPVQDNSNYVGNILRDTSGNVHYRIEDGYTVSNNAIQQPGSLGTRRCMFTTFTPIPPGSTGQCGAQSGDTAAAHNAVPGFGYSYRDRALNISSGAIWLNGWNLQTSVRCSPTASVANTPTGNLDAVTGGFVFSGDALAPIYGGNADVNPIWRSIDGTTKEKALSTQPQRVYYGTIVLVTTETAVKFKPMVRTYTSGSYALSEIGVYVETYVRVWGLGIPGPWTLKSKAYHVISKSECGSSADGVGSLPQRSTAFPSLAILGNESPANNDNLNGFFNTVDRESATSGFTAALVREQRMPERETKEASALTTTSPTGGTTGVEVTTSAPPDDGGGDEDKDGAAAGSASSTSAGTGEESASDVIPDGGSESTSAAPTTTTAREVPTVPDEPGRLPADAELCGSLEVDGEDIDAVAVGECDAAARISAMSALEDYIAEGTQDARWKGFTSDDPGSDGWRWAAIDQRTGNVVYVP